MEISKQKQETLNKLFSEVDKKFGKGTIQFGECDIAPCPVICSTGSLSLDYAIGVGGYPRGRNIEVGGMESSGKTTLSLLAIAKVQQAGEICFFCDAEQSFDPLYASRLGVDVKSLILFQPDDAEMAYELIEDLISTGIVSFGVVDSTSTLVPRAEVAGDYGDAQMGLQARLLSQALRKLNPIVAKKDATIFWISQIRSKIGVMFGSPDVVGVGNAMKFYASLRIKTSRGEVEKSEEEGQESVRIKCFVFKNKVAPAFKTGEFTLLTGVNGEYGLDIYQEVIEYGVKYEFITKAGTWYSVGEEKLGQGKENVKKYLKDNPEKFEEIKKKVGDKLFEDNFKNVNPNPNSFDAKAKEITEEKKRKPRSTKEEEKAVDEILPVSTDEVVKEEKVVE